MSLVPASPPWPTGRQQDVAGTLAGGWAFGGSAPTAAEDGELYVNTDLFGRREPLHLTTSDDLAPLHARAATRAPTRAEVTYTRLDAGGRLPVPLCPVVDVHVRGERDGAVLVVCLPEPVEPPATVAPDKAAPFAAS